MSLLVGVCVALAVVCWPRRGRLVIPASGGGSTELWPRLPRRSPTRRGRRGRAGDVDRLTSMLEGIGPAIAAGVAPSTAVTTSALLAAGSMEDAALRADLHRLAQDAAAGAELAPVRAALHRRHEVPALANVARAWALSEQLGCGIAESLATATAMMREQVDRDRRVDVVTAGPRATMQLLTALPLAGVGIAALIGVSPWRLYAGQLGLAVLLLGALLIFGGRRMVRRMIRHACAPAEIR